MANESFRLGCYRALLAAGMVCVSGCVGFMETAVHPDSLNDPDLGVNINCQKLNEMTEKRLFERVLIIVLENKDEREVMANEYFKDLSKQGTYFSNFHGLFHPSYSNYLAMVSGKKIVTHFDKQNDISDISIADRLKEKKLNWRNYAEGYPAAGECRPDLHFSLSDKYARKHVPFMSFKAIQTDPDACRNIVPGEQFSVDWKSRAIPEYAFYTPDLSHDAHDSPLSDVAVWLKDFLTPLLADADFMRETLTVLTFDESREQSAHGDNHIYTLFLGQMVEPGKIDANSYNHYNVLRTIEDNFGLCPMSDGDGNARPIRKVWR